MTMRGVFRSGKIELPGHPDWPEGCEVDIAPVPAQSGDCMREEDWPTTPEGITALLQRWEQHEPLQMTPEEEAGLAAWRQQVRAHTIANMHKDVERLFE